MEAECDLSRRPPRPLSFGNGAATGRLRFQARPCRARSARPDRASIPFLSPYLMPARTPAMYAAWLATRTVPTLHALTSYVSISDAIDDDGRRRGRSSCRGSRSNQITASGLLCA